MNVIQSLLIWLDARFPLFSTWKRYVSEYYVPKNLNIYYCFGALAIVVLLNQLLSGLWLTMFYTPTVKEAFNSIQYIMRDVNFGWLLRYLHTTGASAFFIVLYIHIFRGLRYGSYQNPRELVWIFGVLLFVLLMAEAFFGYLLPWGQMSYWAAQVITSLLSVIPIIGDTLVTWIRGDYLVSEPTLQRFFALHVIGMPLLILGLVFLHLVALHHVGSNNPQGIDINRHLDHQGKPVDGRPFYPYFVFKDCMAILIFVTLFLSIVFFFPDFNGVFIEPTNAIPANPIMTPELIKPVWYMTPYYAMLRAIPNKFAGVFILISAINILFFLPWLDKSPVKAMQYKGKISKGMFLSFVLSFLMLTYLGCLEISTIKLYLARLGTFIYFAYFLFMPIYTRLEQTQRVPDRVS